MNFKISGLLSISFYIFTSFLIVLSLAFATYPTCPTPKQRSSLQPRLNSPAKIECDCTTETRESAPSWEIMCFQDGHSFDIIPTPNIQDTDQYASLPVLFTIKYVYSSYIEIHCYESSPNFMPAMFQGFQIEEIDSFHVINCSLPTVPFSLIFHRTIIHSEKELSPSSSSSSSSSSKKKPHSGKVKGIKSLKLRREVPLKVSIKQFQDIFLALEGLEQLSLENYQFYIQNNNNNKRRRSRRAPNRGIFGERKPRQMTSSSRTIATSSTNASSVTIFPSSENVSSLNLSDSTFTTRPPSTSPPLLPPPPTHLPLSSALTSPSDQVTDLDKLFSTHVSQPKESYSLNISNYSSNNSHSFSVEEVLKSESRQTNPILSPITPVTTPLPSKAVDVSSERPTLTLSPVALSTQNDDGKGNSYKEVFLTEKSEVTNTLTNGPLSSSSSTSTTVLPIELDYSFGSYFPNLKSLVLYSFLVTKSSQNSQIMKALLSSLTELENLDLKSNELPYLPEKLLFSTGRKLKRLYLMLNSIQTLHPHCFGNLDQVEILDLSNNRIRSIPDTLFSDMINLKHLRIKNNHFITLPSNLFSLNYQLTALDLSSNRNLTSLPVNLLQGLDKLRELTISDCGMSTFTQDSARFFQYASNLEIIDLQNNRLTNLTQSHLFAFNSKLKQLDLSHNRIRHIDADIFTDQTSGLLHLNLYSNEIESIPEGFLKHFRNLKTLNLGGNNLKTINNSFLFGLSNLEILDLSRNQLISVNSDASRTPFGIGSSLKKINLSNNNLTDFNHQFNSIAWDLHVEIEDVNLSQNRLQGHVRIPIFFSTQSKVSLDLRNNLIENINVDAVLRHERNLIELLGSSRSFADTDGNPSSVRVFIAGNPLNCDCDLYPLIKYTRSNTLAKYENLIQKISFDISSDDLKCAQPASLARKSLYELSINDLSCTLDSGQVCPSSCTCLYLAHEERIMIDCQLKNLTKIPHQLSSISNFRNIPLPKNRTISHVRAATIQLQHNRIKNLTQLETLILPSPVSNFNLKNKKQVKLFTSDFPVVSFDLYLDNNTMTTLSPSLIKILRYTASTSSNRNTASDADGATSYVARDAPAAISDSLSSSSSSSLVKFTPRISLSSLSSSSSSYMSSSSKVISSPKAAIINILSLRYNDIHIIPAEFLHDLRELQLLSSSDDSSHTKPRIIKLYLGNNPYNCTPESIAGPGEKPFCQMREFKSWLTSNYRIIGDIGDITCESVYYNSSSALINIPDSVLCPQLLNEDQTLLLTATGICVVLALCLLFLSIIYYRNKQTISAFFYIHLNPIFVCLNFHEDDIDEDKIYDSFVSYSSADRDIVMQLIEKLEQPSSESHISINYLQSQSGLPSIHEGNYDQIVPAVNPEIKVSDKNRSTRIGIGNEDLSDHQQINYEKHNNRSNNITVNTSETSTSRNDDPDCQQYFKLCIHERDWLPGNLISWNIVNSVQNSRRTIIILSKDFIQSIWFQVEFHTAYYQMLEDKIDRLIVIVRGDLPPKEEMDKDLVFLLTTKTYLVWGEKWFWEKLRYALPHKRNRKSSNLSKSFKNANNKNYLKSNKEHGKSKSPSKSEMMKEYVDQAIANHFQLNSTTNGSLSSSANKYNQANLYSSQPTSGNKAATGTSVGITESGEDYQHYYGSKVPEKRSKSNSKQGHINESFEIETQT